MEKSQEKLEELCVSFHVEFQGMCFMLPAMMGALCKILVIRTSYLSHAI